MTDQGPTPGWYDDPAGSDAKRWWDGAAWTDQLQQEPPPPSAIDAPPPSGEPVDSSPPAAKRSRRGLLIGLGAVGLLAAGGIVVALTGLGPSGTTAAGERLPDLTDRPEVAWSLDTGALFDRSIDELDGLSREFEWLPTTADVRGQGPDYLVHTGFTNAWDAGPGRAVVHTQLFVGLGELHGLDTSTGEVRWSSGPLASERTREPVRANCDLAGAHVFCLMNTSLDMEQRAELMVFAVDDGERVQYTDLGGAPNGSRIVAPVDDDVVVLRSVGSSSELVRFNAQGEPVWSRALPRSLSLPFASVVGDWVSVNGENDDADRDWGELVRLDTGEPDETLPPPGMRGNRSTGYRTAGDDLLRVDSTRGSPGGSATYELLEGDGEVRWWVTRDDRLARPLLVSGSGQPLLFVDNDTDVVTALDPDDGEQRWTYRSTDVSPEVLLADEQQVVLMDALEIVRLDARTGELEWSQRHDAGDFSRPVSFGSSVLYLVEDERRVRAYALDDGEPLWSWSAPGSTFANGGVLRDLGGSLVFVRTDLFEALD